jgi:hypothetical protein
MLEDENARGTRFYTVFVQDVPGSEDGDPLTSDGLAIFAGARRPGLAIGDIVVIGGYVTEFYGLTELDNNDLTFWIESRNNPLPQAISLDPPAENALAATYLERYEGMLVSIPVGTAVGPAHAGCGFSLVAKESGISRVLVRSSSDPVGQILGVLHPSDVKCQSMPAVATGDEIAGLTGPLTYHFDRFKIVYQDAASLSHQPSRQSEPTAPPVGQDGQLVIATFNVNDYFDGNDDTGGDAEPKPSPAALSLKQAKIAATIVEGLMCPDVLGLQEVENGDLLAALATTLADGCGFDYKVSHLDGPDARGADVALLSNPERTSVVNVSKQQACTSLETGLVDPEIDCPPGQAPLHSRPPLQVEFVAGGQRWAVLVNHFKSKRDGADETAAWRLAQANHVAELAQDLASSAQADQVVVMGDFNDYDGSAVWQALAGQGDLLDALWSVPAEERYTYIFDGASQLIDWILVSTSLVEKVLQAGIVHSNADYPVQLGLSADKGTLAFRSSDHDIPYIVISTKQAAALTTAETPAPALQTRTDVVATTSRPGEGGGLDGGASGGTESGFEGERAEATSTAVQEAPTASRPGEKGYPMTTGSEDNEKRVWPGRVTLIIFLVVLLLLGITALILAAAIRRKRE